MSQQTSTFLATVSLRLRYRTPLIAMLGAHNFVGGERGIAFTLTNNDGVIILRNDPTPELDRVPSARASPVPFTCNPRTSHEHATGWNH